MKTSLKYQLVLLLMILSHSVPAADSPVLSLHANGLLTWTNTATNATCWVEWAPSLSTNLSSTSWRPSWSELSCIYTGTNTVTTVPVPMFYRVVVDTSPRTVMGGWTFNFSWNPTPMGVVINQAERSLEIVTFSGQWPGIIQGTNVTIWIPARDTDTRPMLVTLTGYLDATGTHMGGKAILDRHGDAEWSASKL